MFKKIANIFSKQNKDLRRRILFTIFCLGFFALGTNITIPWASRLTSDLGFLEIFNLMSGGGLRSYSIFGLGVSPYITASIITQLLQMDIIPYFKELKDQGYVGRQKINKITRYMGIIIAFIQAYALSMFMLKTDVVTTLKISLVMTAGTAFLLWMGDQITQKGIGNGQSLLIMAGILMSLPRVFTGAYNSFINGSFDTGLGITLFALFILVYILIIVGIIWVQLAERRIPIQYSNRTTSAYGAQTSFLPIKINSASVIPVIFASIITTIPATIVQLIGNESAINFVRNYINYTTSATGFILYIVLIFAFTYFYTFLTMNPEEMSKNLNQNGGYIPGVRPGEDTTKYISKSLSRLTFVGAIFLVILAGIPVMMSMFTSLPSSVSLGGTGILIVVGVAIETYKQIESSLTARSYSARKKRFR